MFCETPFLFFAAPLPPGLARPTQPPPPPPGTSAAWADGSQSTTSPRPGDGPPPPPHWQPQLNSTAMVNAVSGLEIDIRSRANPQASGFQENIRQI